MTNLPEGKKAIGCKWVYANKEGFPGQDDVRYKARLVAKGYAQKEGIDYNENFYPLVKHSSIRILLALVAQLDLELVHMDVKTVFLHGDLDEEIYMVQPEGFKVAGKEHEVCKLHKSLYGLKQSPRQWYKRFDKFMMESKYTRSKYDHCVYLKKLQDGSFVYLLLYVDDMLIASQSSDEIEKLKTRLKSEFEMKDLGEAKMILGMEIVRDRKLMKLCLTQKQYLRRVLKRFRFDKQTKRVSTPLASQFKINAAMSPKDDAERAYMEKVPYANVVGSLMYAMICTRPDISHDVGMSTTALSTTEAEYMAMTEVVKEAIWLQGLLSELGIK
ncbi:transposable element [Tanacetum coccineum]